MFAAPGVCALLMSQFPGLRVYDWGSDRLRWLFSNYDTIWGAMALNVPLMFVAAWVVTLGTYRHFSTRMRTVAGLMIAWLGTALIACHVVRFFVPQPV